MIGNIHSITGNLVIKINSDVGGSKKLHQRRASKHPESGRGWGWFAQKRRACNETIVAGRGELGTGISPAWGAALNMLTPTACQHRESYFIE